MFHLLVRILGGNFVSVHLYVEQTVGDLLNIGCLRGDQIHCPYGQIEQIWGIPREEAREMKLRTFLKRIIVLSPWYRTAFVGLFWYFHGAVAGNLYHLTNAYLFDRFLGPYRSHEDFWPMIPDTAKEGMPGDEASLPRGRVLFDFRNRRFVIIAEPSILSDPRAIDAVVEAFCLPDDVPRQFEEDPLYGPFPNSFPVDPTPVDCLERRCSSHDTDGWMRIIEKPHQFLGWTRQQRVLVPSKDEFQEF